MVFMRMSFLPSFRSAALSPPVCRQRVAALVFYLALPRPCISPEVTATLCLLFSNALLSLPEGFRACLQMQGLTGTQLL